MGRLLIIERKDAIVWNVDPAASRGPYDSQPDIVPHHDSATENTPLLQPSRLPPSDTPSIRSLDDYDDSLSLSDDTAKCPQPLSIVDVVIKLAKSPRALVALIITFSYG